MSLPPADFPLIFKTIDSTYQEYEIDKKKILSDLQELRKAYIDIDFISNHNFRKIIVVGNDIHAQAAKAWTMIPYSWVNLYKQYIDIIYLDSFSPDSLWEIIANCPMQETCVIFISYEARNVPVIITLMRFIESIRRYVDDDLNKHIIIATNKDLENSDIIACAELFSLRVLPLSTCIFQPFYPGVLIASLLWGISAKKILNSLTTLVENIVSNTNILKNIFQLNHFFYLKNDYIKIIAPTSDKLRPIALWWQSLIENKIDLKHIQVINTMKPIYYINHFLHKSYTSILIDESLPRDSIDFSTWQWKFQEQWREISSITLKKWIEENNQSVLSWIESNHGKARIIRLLSTTQEEHMCAIMLYLSLEVSILCKYLNLNGVQYALEKTTYDRLTR